MTFAVTELEREDTYMMKATDILKKLADLDKQLEASMRKVKTSPDEPTWNNGFVVGLNLARRGIHDIFLEVDKDNRKAKQLLKAIFQEMQEDEK